MNNKTKRILVGLVLPTIVMLLICGGFFYKNAFSHLKKPTQKTTEEKVQTKGTITLTKANWEEYFEYVEEYVQVKNDAGEVEEIYLDAYYKMKDEYYERLVSASDSVILMVDVDDIYKKYEIVDPVSGEWEFTGEDSKYESKFYEMYISAYVGSDRDMCYWESDINRCDVSGSIFFEDVQEEMILRVVNEVEIRAVEGQITLK